VPLQTGYNETDLTDNKAVILRWLSFALPTFGNENLSDLQSKFGYGISRSKQILFE
jgi:hypothetical protein